MTNLPLTEGFDARNEEHWRTQIDKILKGADFEKRLVSKTADGIALQPLYMQAAGAAPVASTHPGHPWQLTQRVDHPDPETANRQAHEDLRNGAGALALVFPAGRSARGFGLACDTVDHLDTTLANVDLEMIHLRVEPAPAGRINAGLIAALVAKRGMAPDKLSISFGLDPIGSLLTLGSFPSDWPETGRRLGDVVTTLSDSRLPRARSSKVTCAPITRPARPRLRNSPPPSQPAFLYWQALIDNGIPQDKAERALAWTFAVDADQFLSIAKLRAMRRLWARVQDASGVPANPIRLHAETAWRMPLETPTPP